MKRVVQNLNSKTFCIWEGIPWIDQFYWHPSVALCILDFFRAHIKAGFHKFLETGLPGQCQQNPVPKLTPVFDESDTS